MGTASAGPGEELVLRGRKESGFCGGARHPGPMCHLEEPVSDQHEAMKTWPSLAAGEVVRREWVREVRMNFHLLGCGEEEDGTRPGGAPGSLR